MVGSKTLAIFILAFSFQAWAAGLSCQQFLAGTPSTSYLRVSELKRAFEKIEEAFASPSSRGHEGYLSEPFSALLYPEGGFAEGETWRDRLKSVRFTQETIDKSWQAPQMFSYLPLILYKGHLFPGSYFIRRTSTGHGLNRSIPFDFSSFGKNLPYVEIGKSAVTIHSSGGSKKLFDLWAQDHIKSDGFVELHRAAAESEYKLQVFIGDLSRKDVNQRATIQERNELDQIVLEMAKDYNYHAIKSLLSQILENPSPTRREVIDQITTSIGFFSGGIFTAFDYSAALSFKAPEQVVITYKIPLSQLRELVYANRVYFGVEFNYFEIAFIDKPDDQRAKNLLFHSITHVNGQPLQPNGLRRQVP
jgi:hypothetical protein